MLSYRFGEGSSNQNFIELQRESGGTEYKTGNALI